VHRWCPHKANGGTAAYSVCAPFKGLVAVRWSKSKMATGPQVVCGGSSKEWPFVRIGRSGNQQRSAWDLIQLSVQLRQWRKMPHRGQYPRPASYHGVRLAIFRLRQTSAEQSRPCVATGVGLSSSLDATSRHRLTTRGVYRHF
jgi:hypothetical protein